MTLAKIIVRFEQSCNAIDYLSNYALRLDTSEKLVAKATISYCIVKLHDHWNARCRELIIKSALGNYKTLSGSLLPRSTQIDPLQHLRNLWSQRKPMDTSWEPDWHIPANSMRAARLLNISNLNTVVNALSAITIIDELRWTRNAIAHELPRTYQMFRQHQSIHFLPPNYSPADYAIQRIPGKPDLVLDAWMNEMKLALMAAIK